MPTGRANLTYTVLYSYTGISYLLCRYKSSDYTVLESLSYERPPPARPCYESMLPTHEPSPPFYSYRVACGSVFAVACKEFLSRSSCKAHNSLEYRTGCIKLSRATKTPNENANHVYRMTFCDE
jgi:hypothetical protein